MELICFSPDCGAWFGSRREHKGLRRKGATAVEGLYNYKAGAEISCGGCYCCFGWGWGVVVAGFGFGLVAGAFVVFFFTGFFAGSVSSTTTFLGGCALAAWSFCSAVRSRLSSISFPPEKFSMRSENERRERSRALSSFSKD